MDTYIISYRGKAVRTVRCYTSTEAKDKAKYWYKYMCRDDNRDRRLLKVITPSGTALTVF